ncbi:MAG: hypothetical protein JWQ49_1726 [Edaphobacter sp.]|nr:hypothetical protein [Edaphobacter sp.]
MKRPLPFTTYDPNKVKLRAFRHLEEIADRARAVLGAKTTPELLAILDTALESALMVGAFKDKKSRPLLESLTTHEMLRIAMDLSISVGDGPHVPANMQFAALALGYVDQMMFLLARSPLTAKRGKSDRLVSELMKLSAYAEAAVSRAEGEVGRAEFIRLRYEVQESRTGRSQMARSGAFGKKSSFASKKRKARSHYLSNRLQLDRMKISAAASEIKQALFPNEPPAASGIEDWVSFWRKARQRCLRISRADGRMLSKRK